MKTCRIKLTGDGIASRTLQLVTSAQVQSLDLSDLGPGTYFWRVSALDAEGYESAWSHTAHFIYPMSLR